MNEHARACEAERNASGGMSGACPSSANKSLHLKPIHSCRKRTIGDIKENRAEANVRRGEAGGDGWIFKKKKKVSEPSGVGTHI